jgi:hypothetical protein
VPGSFELTRPDHTEQTKEFRTRMNGDELPILWSSFALVRASDVETLLVRQNEVIRLLEGRGFECMVEDYLLQAAFVAMFPGHDHLYLRHHLMQKTDVGDLSNTHVPSLASLGNSSSDGYFQDRFHVPFAYDPFINKENVPLRAICGSADDRTKFSVVNRNSQKSFYHLIYLCWSWSVVFVRLFIQLCQMPHDYSSSMKY